MGGIFSEPEQPNYLFESYSEHQHFLEIVQRKTQDYERFLRPEACQLEARQLKARQLEARQLEAWELEARQLEAWQLKARQLEARQLEAWELQERQLEARKLEARKLEARQLEARQLEARQLEARKLEARKLEARQLEARQLEARQLEARQLEAIRKKIQQLPYDVSPQYSQLSTISFHKNNILLHTKYNWSRKKHLTPLHRVLLPKAETLQFYSKSLSEIYCQTIDEYDDTYEEVMQHFMKSSQKYYLKVESIEEVFNLFTRCFYLLKKEEYKVLYKNVQERLLFHGTKSETVDIILQENFNWRLHGTSKGNIFGKGVSFSPFPTYSSDYCRPRKGSRVMIAAKVLQAHAYNGNNEMILPPEIPGRKGLRYDTSKKPNGQVVVKYCDDEFCPFYKVTFSGNSFKKYDG